MIGIYMRLEGDKGSLTGYFRLRGEVDVLGLISAAIELYLSLTYQFDTGKMSGQAITVQVKVLVFSGSVKIRRAHVRRLERRSLIPPGDGRRDRNLICLDRILRGVRESLMPTEIFSVCALPYSCASGDAFQVSLFVSPKLTPDQPSDELRMFSLFPHWGELVKQHMTVELTDQAGPIEAAALLAGVKPAVWDAAFPPETPVKGQPVPEWQGRRWRTFDARKVHDLGKAVHLATMYASPTSPPMPADHPLAGPLAELSGRYYRIEQLTEFTRRSSTRVAHDRRPR